jgi:hypothetical protein
MKQKTTTWRQYRDHSDGCFCDQTTTNHQNYHINDTNSINHIVDDAVSLLLIVVW